MTFNSMYQMVQKVELALSPVTYFDLELSE